jgi:hypothetical protein
LAHAASRVVDRADLAVKPLLTVHIAAALGLFGVSTVLLVGSLHAATRDDPQDAHATYTLLRLLTFSVDIPLASITLLAGPGARPNLEVADLPLPVGPSEAGPLHRDPNGRRNPDRPEHRHHLDVTEAGSPNDSSTRWALVSQAGAQVTMLTAATLGVFKPGGLAHWRAFRRLTNLWRPSQAAARIEGSCTGRRR